MNISPLQHLLWMALELFIVHLDAQPQSTRGSVESEIPPPTAAARLSQRLEHEKSIMGI